MNIDRAGSGGGYHRRSGRTGITGADGSRQGGLSIHTGTDAGRDVLLNSPDGWVLSEPWRWWDGPADDHGGMDSGSGRLIFPVGNPPPGAGMPLRLPAAVTRCTALIADTLAGMPWQVYREYDKLPAPDWITDPQARRLDQRILGGPVPDWRVTTFEFRSRMIRSMLWSATGEAMVYVPSRTAAGAPAPPLWLINPDDVGIDGGRWVIGQGGDGSDDSGYTFAPGELIVIRGMERGGLRGIGVLQAHLEDIRLGESMRDFAWNMLKAGIPNGYLKVNSPNLTVEKAREVQREWMRQHGGPVKKIAVLNATTDFHALTLDPQALQLAQMRDFANLDWALAFGVPPWFLGVKTDSNTYANVTSRFIELAEFTLLPWARRIESALEAEFPRGTDLKINLDSLRRADTLTRYQAHQISLAQPGKPGWAHVDEVRALENMPPLTAKQKKDMGIGQQPQQPQQPQQQLPAGNGDGGGGGNAGRSNGGSTAGRGGDDDDQQKAGGAARRPPQRGEGQ